MQSGVSLRPLILSTLLAVLFAGPSHAQEDEPDPRQQIEELVARNAWSAADRVYIALLDQGLRLDDADHFRGARAAMALGRINDAVARLEQARKHPESQPLLDQIATGYGAVKLSVPGSHSGGVPFRSTDAMIDPLHRTVVQAAKEALESDGSYKGLLPLGNYKIGDTAFEVVIDGTAKAKLK